MKNKIINKIFIATSMDGFIADKNGNIDWLNIVPNPDNDDMGYDQFMNGIDAIVMGRNTYEKVLSFGIDWPYTKPVYVLSSTLNTIPKNLEDKVYLNSDSVEELSSKLQKLGYSSVYVDGGGVIQQYLEAGLVDELTITTIPLLLGDGIPLFRSLKHPLHFECVSSKIYLGKISQNYYVKSSY